MRVSFDLSLVNRLANTDLVPSTFPVPPAAQVVAFPFATDPAGLFGLRVKASTDWNGTGASGSGALYNFFNDAICIDLTPPSDCFRWEAFGSQIAAGGGAGPRRVGFDIDATVTSFTVYVAVAADIQERATPPGRGAVVGLVASPQLGPLSGVEVTVGSARGLTDENGVYSVGGLQPGPAIVELHGLLTAAYDCISPGPTEIVVLSGEAVQANFTVDCPPVTGILRGRVFTTSNVSLGYITIRDVVGVDLHAIAVTDVAGFFVTEVHYGEHTVVLDDLPDLCTNPGAQTIVVPRGGVAELGILVTCTSLVTP